MYKQNYCYLINNYCSKDDEQSSLPERTAFLAYDTHSKNINTWKTILNGVLHQHDFALDSYDVGVPLAMNIFCNICERIKRSAFVIADVGCWDDTSSRYMSNPNVMHEVGFATGLNKPIILLADSTTTTGNLRGQQVFSIEHPEVVTEIINKYCTEIPAFLHIENLSTYLDIQNRLFSIEKLQGKRIYVSDRLSILTRPLSFSQRIAEERKETHSWTNNDVEQFMDTLKQRLDLFEDNISGGKKYIDIYDKHRIINFFRDGKAYSTDVEVSVEDRITHLDRVLSLLEKPNYELLLAENLEIHNLLLKKGQVLAFTPARGRYGDWSSCTVMTLKSMLDYHTGQVEETIRAIEQNLGRDKNKIKHEFTKLKKDLEQ